MVPEKLSLSIFCILISYIGAKIAGVSPFNLISVLKPVAGTAIIRILAVYAVHPAGVFATVKLIKLVDSLNIIALVQWCITGCHMDSLLSADLLQNIKNSFAALK